MGDTASGGAGALAGVRVLDIGTMIAPNYTSALLGDFGAQVIKVELPGVGDTVRKVGPYSKGQSLRWPGLGRNKQCITLDLRQDEGKALFKRLLAKCDVLLENFRPGTLDGWGLSFETLRQVNPKIIVARISGYGQTGPYRYKAGFGTPCTAFSGFTYIQGFKDRPPVSPSFSLIDYIAGLHMAWSICMALYKRDAAGGPGQEIDVSLYEPTFRMMEFLVGQYDQLGTMKERTPMISDTSSPAGTYETADGKYVVLVCSTDPTYRRLVDAMGRPELKDDPKFDSNQHRIQNNAELDGIVRAWMGARPRAEVLRILDANGVPVSPINSTADVFADEHFAARADIVEVPHPIMGHIKLPGITPKFSETPGEIKFAGARLGEHNADIYSGLLGLSADEMAALQARGIV